MELHPRKDPFSVLPVEACCQVLSFLPPQTIALCCLVSSQWKEICDDESFWRTMYVKSVRQEGLGECASKTKTAPGITWKQMCLNLTLNFGESKILDKELRQTLTQWVGAREARWVLHYRGSRDGFSLDAFHRFNDCVGPTVCVAHSPKDCIFGGYNAVSWITLRQDSDESANLALRSHAIGVSDDDDAESEEEQIKESLEEENLEEEKEPATDDELADATHDVAVDTTTDHAHLESAAADDDDEAAAATSRKKRRTKKRANTGDGDVDVDHDKSEEKQAQRKAALEAKRAKRARKARDARLAAEKGLPTEPFIFSLKNLWDKPPTQIFTRQRGDKNGVLVHEYYGPLWGSGFDLGILGHPHETPPSAWCRIGTTYASPYLATETGGSAHYFIGGDPRDFEICELEVFVLKEEKEEWANRLRSQENAGRTANADSLRPRA